MEGTLQETFHRINERAEKQFFMIFNKLLETYPAPKTDDILEVFPFLDPKKEFDKDWYEKNDAYDLY